VNNWECFIATFLAAIAGGLFGYWVHDCWCPWCKEKRKR
jgi:hypothetical protein